MNRWRTYLPETLGAIALAALLVLHLRAELERPHSALDYVLVLVGTSALALSRRAPGLVLLVTTTCMAIYTLRLHPGNPAALPVLGAVYMAARAGNLLAPVASAGFLAVFLGMDIAEPVTDPPSERTTLILGWFIAANVAGAVSRRRKAYLEQVEERAREAERTREEAALRRAGEERLRIARELHDTLTHSISIIKLQANVAIHLARKRGEEPPEALLAIQEASGEAMRELRSTLEVLRRTDETAEDGLARIEALLERSRSAGVPASLAVTGDPATLPPEVAQAAYRIVQEALTNVSRHAPGASVTVHVQFRPDQVLVRVADDGPQLPHPPAFGNGLTGMRERVTALGGTLRAEPGPERGFTVQATLPLARQPEPAAVP